MPNPLGHAGQGKQVAFLDRRRLAQGYRVCQLALMPTFADGHGAGDGRRTRFAPMPWAPGSTRPSDGGRRGVGLGGGSGLRGLVAMSTAHTWPSGTGATAGGGRWRGRDLCYFLQLHANLRFSHKEELTNWAPGLCLHCPLIPRRSPGPGWAGPRCGGSQQAAQASMGEEGEGRHKNQRAPTGWALCGLSHTSGRV